MGYFPFHRDGRGALVLNLNERVGGIRHVPVAVPLTIVRDASDEIAVMHGNDRIRKEITDRRPNGGFLVFVPSDADGELAQEVLLFLGIGGNRKADLQRSDGSGVTQIGHDRLCAGLDGEVGFLGFLSRACAVRVYTGICQDFVGLVEGGQSRLQRAVT